MLTWTITINLLTSMDAGQAVQKKKITKGKKNLRAEQFSNVFNRGFFGERKFYALCCFFLSFMLLVVFMQIAKNLDPPWNFRGSLG